jgi:hypothetical protein
MAPTIPIEQAIYGNPGAGGYRFLARSPGFADDWLAEAERICTGFGERPAGVACPGAIFAQPFGLKHIAVVQVADMGADDAGRPGALAFRLLAVPRKAYETFLGDPFAIADHFPPPWEARGALPALTWSADSAPPCTVAEVQQLLQQGNSATLLGGAQALVDGSRIVFERSAPDPDLARRLWALLPYSTRCRLWPASFAFGNALGFDLLVVPRADEATFASYLTEEQAGDYPQGRYELNLQIAAEAGDQRELDALLCRRSSGDTLKLAFLLLVGIAVLAVTMQLLNHASSPHSTATPITVVIKPETPPTLVYGESKMPGKTRQQVAAALKQVVHDLGMPPVKHKGLLSSMATVEDLLKAIDEHARPPYPERAGVPVHTLGNTEQQLRGLLWKHHVPEFNDPGLTPVELVERLHKKLLAEKEGSAGA